MFGLCKSAVCSKKGRCTGYSHMKWNGVKPNLQGVVRQERELEWSWSLRIGY